MTPFVTDRRRLIAGLAVMAFLPAVSRADTPSTTLALKLPDGREITATQWLPAAPKAAVLISHDAGGWPEQYDRLAQMLAGQGYAVIAPLHSDSMHVPDDKRTTIKAGFSDRQGDMAAAGAHAKASLPGLPVVAMGHGYGSLFALILAGGLAYLNGLANPDVKAVVCYSSAGVIRDVVTPAAYTTLAAPLLIVTGDKDIAPGYVGDWHDHLMPFDATPVKESYALIIKDGTHDLISGADSGMFDLAAAVTRDFLARELFQAVPTINLPSGARADLKSKLS